MNETMPSPFLTSFLGCTRKSVIPMILSENFCNLANLLSLKPKSKIKLCCLILGLIHCKNSISAILHKRRFHYI
jgi:hypothetical protein